MITKMSHVLIWVKNQQEALEFYRDKLGFEVDTDAEIGPGFRWLTMKIKGQPGFEIILVEPNPGMMLDEESAAQLRSLLDKGVLGGGVFDADDIHKTYEELKARLAEMEKQQGPRRTGSLEFRVGEKGGVSVYGLGRFPVTLYYEQWIRLLDAGDKLREFLEENKSKLKLKG